jgi:Tfp pilus assembly protein PilV
MPRSRPHCRPDIRPWASELARASGLRPEPPATRCSLPATLKAFTIVEVMMAAVILVVGFMGMIQAITIGSEMLATARRQNIAAQIIAHETEKLRLLPWDVTTGAPNELCINDLAAGPTTIAIDSRFTSSIAATGLTEGTSASALPYIQLQRSVATITTDLREVTFTVTWRKSGTSAAANTATGTWLEILSLSGSAPIDRTYTRSSTAYFGKYGLNLNAQRS